MENRWSLRKQNTGASLVAVIIALVVVGIIGMLIMQLTMTNIHMKEVESSSKKNFYKTEECIDEISVELNSIASDCMQEAYITILENYAHYSATGTDMQGVFAELYLDNLLNALKVETASVETIPVIGIPTGKRTLYRTDLVAAAMTSGTFTTTNTEAILYVDLTEKTVRLKNIKVKYNNTGDYETAITTDIVFETPKLNFKGKNKVTDYMKYALIADDQIYVNASGIRVDGNAYAGVGGIEAISTADGTFVGNTIVTRGDIASSGGNLTVGDGTTGIWAENICTKAGAGKISLKGNSYIADDLTLNARNSHITLQGEYYGYNFQEKYGTKTDTKDADFSSAMIINAKNSRLDISGLSYMLLAGRTYISSGNSGSDVPMGESLSVRANQLAYYVDESYLEHNADGSITKNADGTIKGFSVDGKTAYVNDTGMSDIDNYLKTSEPVVAYSFIDTVSGIQTYYYLNFKDEQNANSFYSAYVSRNKTEIDTQAEGYLNHEGLQLNPTTVLTLKGDILYRDGARALQEGAVTINGADWDVSGTYWDYAKKLAIKYKSLQLSLTETETGITGEDVRFTKPMGVTYEIDKTVDNLFDRIVDKAAIQANFSDTATTLVNDSGATVVFVDNEGVGSTSYRVPTGAKGIVVATGDVMVEGTYEGMILSGGTISFASGASVKGNSVLVADLFQKDAELSTPLFTMYFRDYGTLEESVIGTVEVSDYLSFQNWQKN